MKKDSLKTVKVKTVKTTKVSSGITYHLFIKWKPIIETVRTTIGQMKKTNTNSITFSPFLKKLYYFIQNTAISI